MRILIDNLPDDVTEEGIREALSAFASVVTQDSDAGPRSRL
jgi:hypothetical protein